MKTNIKEYQKLIKESIRYLLDTDTEYTVKSISREDTVITEKSITQQIYICISEGDLKKILSLADFFQNYIFRDFNKSYRIETHPNIQWCMIHSDPMMYRVNDTLIYIGYLLTFSKKTKTIQIVFTKITKAI